jgi:DNA polymerase II large subunit
VFKDGTTRFDMTDALLTHFKPREIGVSIKRLKELGYRKDYLGNDLVNENQICDMKVQDVIISKSCAEYFARVSKFVDDLLLKFYSLDRFYNIKKLEDLIGHLIIGLAPHTSAGSLGRIIGFTDTQVCFAHPFYHAAKRRNCLFQNTDILVSKSGYPVITSVKELYNSTDSKENIVDDFGTKLKKVNGVTTFSLNPYNGRLETKKIKTIIKARSPKYLIKVKLASGREVITSPYHRVVVWSNGKILRKKTLELDKGDKFFISKEINIGDKDIEEIDLLSEFSQINNRDVVVRGIQNFSKKCIGESGGLKSTSKKLGINKKTFSNYIYRDSMPLFVLLKLVKLCQKDTDDIPKDCTIGVKRDHTGIPRIIRVNKQLMRLLGYYISEGYARCTKKNCYQISFTCVEEEIKDDIIQCIKDVFKIRGYVSNSGISICNRLIHDFLVKILKIGTNARNTRFPPRFTALPKNKIKELLRAYFSVDGSAEKNRLHITCPSVNKSLLRDIGLQLLRFGIFYRLKEERRKVVGYAKKFYNKKGKSPIYHLHYISIRSSYARKFYDEIGFTLQREYPKQKSVIFKEIKPRIELFGDYVIDKIKEITLMESNSTYVYDIEVENLHNFPVNDFIVSNNCDGDEDGVMLLMDALLNFSHAYIPEKRGGKMDLPLILTTRIDPSEVDKEAHNVDTLARYPLDFYEATLRHEHSKELEPIMGLVSSRLGYETQYEEFGFTHDTYDISEGPKTSTYKTLKTMMDKMNSQLNLAARIRAVDEADVAYKVIERHFLPDILGNFRAFSKQSVRCPTCNITFRRIPLLGVCTKCDGKLTLTVHEKSVKKYLAISKEIAQRYHIPSYAFQRITLVEKSINSLFMSDKLKTTKLTDFL